MKKRILIVLGVLCISTGAWAQSTIRFLNSNPLKLPFESIWMSNYSNEQGVGSSIHMELELRKSGQLIYKAISSPIVLHSKVQVLNPVQSGLESEVFLDQRVEKFVRNSNVLPNGAYSACIRVKSQAVQAASRQSEVTTCIEFNVEQSSLLRLTHIPNGSEVSGEELPVFSWFFLSTSFNASQIQYTLKVCPVLRGQSKEDAVLRNLPLLVEEGILASSFQYPVDARNLEENKEYAWCIEARADEQLIAKSEVWGFSIEESKEEVIVGPTMSYLDLDQHENRGQINVSGSAFNFRFDHSENQNETITFSVLDEKGKKLKSAFDPYQTVYGANYVSLDLSLVKRLKDERSYTLIIHNGEAEQKIDFIYSKPQ